MQWPNGPICTKSENSSPKSPLSTPTDLQLTAINSKVNLDKVNDWISKGAKPSPTVKSLIKKAQLAAK